MRLSDVTDTTADAMRSAGTYLSDLTTPTLRLGVTGLSRAGKTVFITALVHALSGGVARPALPISHLGNFRGFLEPQPDDDVPRFAYEQHLAMLQDTDPAWPQSTRHISQLRLTLEWEANDWARRTAGIGRRLHVDIVDYPGEWLLDLGLLDTSYIAWSNAMGADTARRARDGRVEAWLAFAGQHTLDEPADEKVAIEGAELFTAYLASVRDNDRFARMISPGRFLLPGDLEGSPLLTFFPIAQKPAQAIQPNTLGALLERRFESYKRQVVQPFFERHFKSLDRQIVLVDVLSALNGGPEAVSELEESLLGALNAFRPGRESWLAGLLGRRIDRVLFAATKADHIHSSNHRRLRAIMKALVGRAAKRTEATGATFDVLALASLRASDDVEHGTGDEAIPCIQGRPVKGEQVNQRRFDGLSDAVLFPGDLPDDPFNIFDHDQFSPGTLNFVRFQAPSLVIRHGHAADWPHTGLDDAVRFLIGDRLT